MWQRLLALLGSWIALGTTVALAATEPDSSAGLPATEPTAVVLPGTLAGAAGGTAEAVAPRGWRALPAALAAHGITTTATLTGLWIGDVAGGRRTGGTVQSLAYGTADVDLEKLVPGWHGGHALANLAYIHGPGLSDRFVGDALVASNLEGFGSLRLYNVWVEQSFAGDRASVRAGTLGADEEFSGTEGGSMLTNSAFGWEAGIGANVVNGGPIYFVPALGARLEVRATDGWTLRAGAFDGDAFDSPDGDPEPSAHGLHLTLSSEEGAFVIGESEVAWGRSGGTHPGALKLGAWGHTADFPDLRFDAAGQPVATSGLAAAMHHGNAGGYAVLEQSLWSAPSREGAGIACWSRLAAAPADRSPYAWVGEAGLRWTGPLAGRDADAIALGWVGAFASPDARDAVRDANAADGGSRPLAGHEGVLEAAWQWRIGAHASVTPDLQWIQHPGATAATANATVVGLRFGWE